MSFAEKGAVADIEPAFFVGYLHQIKATGTLKFEDAPIQRAVYFREGRILFSSSNAPEDQLGAILIAGGKISQQQFDALVAALEPKQSIAAALAQGGHVSQRDIGDAARRKVEQIVGSCCTQTTGRYEFEDGVLPKGALDLKLTTERVLVSAFDVLEPSGFLIRVLKSPMAVLAQGAIVPADPDLARLREALDGMSSLADIGGTVGLPLAATEARAAVLVVLGAASVVTSQIEEMALPDTGETSPDLPAMNLTEESEPVEAETIGFGEMSAGLGQSSDADATLVTSGLEAPASDPSAESTLVMGSGLVPPPASPSESGSFRAAGGQKRATTQDLDAVKELIGAPPGPTRPTSSSIPQKQWEPVLSAAGRPNREATGLAAVFQNPMVKRVGGAVLLLAVIGFGWMAYMASQAPPAPRPSPSPVPEPAAGVASVAPGALTPDVPGATLAVPSPSSTAPSAASNPPPPAATPAAVPSSTPVPKATPKPPTTPTPTPRPLSTPSPAVARATPAAGPVVSGSGYDTMKAGRLSDAATIFASAARSRAGEFSVQLLVACSAQTIEKALQNDPSPELFVLPATVAGKACYRMMRGYYSTEDAAARAVLALPPYYVTEGAKPRAIAIRTVLP